MVGISDLKKSRVFFRDRARRIPAEPIFQIERSAFHSYGLGAHACGVLGGVSTGGRRQREVHVVRARS